ncbi:MAG: hypothetical protein KAH22_08755 [Thiotrichaceae bacterium]|nr:hypothetical protein [Thiotrichaceae bacterium]
MIMTIRLVALASLLFVLSGIAQSEPAKNEYRDKAKDGTQSIETLIRQHLSLRNMDVGSRAPVLAKDYAIPIRNPFLKLPEATYQAFAKKGIDLKGMSKYKALYMAGELTGVYGVKVVNTKANVVLVIGTKSITHQTIFSRGPVVVLGKSNMMSGIYSKDLLWAINAIGSPMIGYPSVYTLSTGRNYSPYTNKEELQKIAALGQKKTTYTPSEFKEIKDILLHKSKEIFKKIVLRIEIPDLKEVNNTERNQYRCANYAKTAVEQHQINLDLKCGFKGLRWNKNKKGQENWCLTVLDILSDKENIAREEKLSGCFTKKTSSSNPSNQLKLPKECHNPDRKYTPVKSIYYDYKYNKEIAQLVQDGLIEYDYNKDGKKDFVFVEQSKKEVKIAVCMSSQSNYQRLKTNMNHRLDQSITDSQKYNINQDNDQLIIRIDRFAHNDGSSFRVTNFRYNTTKQAFEIIKSKTDVSTVSSGGLTSIMGLPDVPEIF